MITQQIIQQARRAAADCAIGYVDVDAVLSGSDFETQFRAIHIQTGGDVTIKGLDGNTVTMTLSSGYYPGFAGQAIIAATTTAAGIFAIL